MPVTLSNWPSDRSPAHPSFATASRPAPARRPTLLTVPISSLCPPACRAASLLLRLIRRPAATFQLPCLLRLSSRAPLATRHSTPLFSLLFLFLFLFKSHRLVSLVRIFLDVHWLIPCALLPRPTDPWGSTSLLFIALLPLAFTDIAVTANRVVVFTKLEFSFANAIPTLSAWFSLIHGLGRQA
jgi:hypothetical protein